MRTPQPLEVDAELAFIRVRKTGPEPQLRVNTRCTALPSLENRIEVKEWVTQTGILIALLLNEFTEPPEEIVDATRWLID